MNQENVIEIFSGTKNVIQNNSMVFELCSQKWRAFLPLLVMLFVFAGMIFFMFQENPETFEMLRSEDTRQEITAGISSLWSVIPTDSYFAIGVFILLILFAFASSFFRKAYIRIDSTQLILKSSIDQWLGKHGEEYIVASPATVTGQMKGHGKNRRVEIVVTTTGGETKKIKLAAQVFGDKALKMLIEWLKTYRKGDFDKAGMTRGSFWGLGK